MSYTSAKGNSLFLLPKLKDGGSDVGAGNAGEWDIRPPETYQKIASSLDLGNDSDGQQLRNVTAIPNMWARALLMESAMYNTNYPQRSIMIEQWRGMLAAIALAEIRQFDIKVKLVRLSESKKNDRFARSLEHLLPEPKYALYNLNDNANPWQDVYVFLWQGRSVGISSPSTLVCPSQEGDWSGLPWFQGNTLRSPSNQDLGEEKTLLCGWLDNLITKLPERQYSSNDDARSTITTELAKFRDSFDNVTSSIPLLSDKPRFFGEEISRGALQLLNKPAKSLPKESSVRLISNKLNAPELLIIDVALNKQWDLGSHEICVYEDKTLATKNLLGDLSSKTLGKDNQGKSVNWIDANELLLPELYFFSEQSALPHSLLSRIKNSDTLVYEGKIITILLPINKLLLDYFSPEELANIIEINPIDSLTIELTLNLQLSGVKDKSRYYYTRKYSIKLENALTQSVPIFEIWPNFQTAGWKEYYAFYSEKEQSQGNIKLQVEFANQQHFQEKSGHDDTGILWRYEWTKLEDFPTHVICKDKTITSKILGIVLLKRPLQINSGDSGKLKVGVDFGTSSTNVFTNKDGIIEKLDLTSLHFSVTESNYSESRNVVLIEAFMTDAKKITELPLSTILTTRLRSENLKTKQFSEVEPIFDGCIYIPPDKLTEKTKKPYIKTGLKWSIEKEAKIATKLFLKHLALKISALAAKDNIREIEWFISFPSAFSISEQNAYFDGWKKIISELQKTTGIKHVYPDTISDSEHWKSESVAIAQYFADKEDENLVYSTCIDVGGGTSDISIWEDNYLLHQCSIRFAGSNLLAHFLEINPKFVDENFKPHNVQWAELKDAKFSSEWDLWLRRNGSEWLENNRDALLASNSKFQELLQLTCLGVCGLYYYVGMILHVLHYVDKKYKIGEITPIYLGGNGANIWHWLSEGGNFDNMREINKLFSKMLEKGSSFSVPKIKPKTRLSRDLKSEVACGLVLNDTKLGGWDQDENGDRLDWTKEELIAGEYCCINGQSIDPYERLPVSGNIDISTFEIPDTLSNLRKFVADFNVATKALNIQGIRPINISDEDFNTTYRELKAMLLNFRGRSNEIRIEPPFILALKALLKTLGKKWASKK